MTDEEDLEYAVQHVCLNCSELGECDKGVHCEFLKIVRECYDDAIEIGRKEKWHDLRKNLEDLPEEGKEVLVLYSNFYDGNGLMVNKYTLRYKLAQYINDEDDLTEWYWVESGLDDMVHEVIAWCELPKFEE